MNICELKSINFPGLTQQFTHLSEISDKLAKEEDMSIRRELFKKLKQAANNINNFIKEILE